jgi:hypothetical protein
MNYGYGLSEVDKRKKEAEKKFGFIPIGYELTNSQCYERAIYLTDRQIFDRRSDFVDYTGKIYNFRGYEVTNRYDKRLVACWTFMAGYGKVYRLPNKKLTYDY